MLRIVSTEGLTIPNLFLFLNLKAARLSVFVASPFILVYKSFKKNRLEVTIAELMYSS